MVNSQIVHIEGIGEVLLEPSARARRVVISVRPGKGVRVAVPRHASIASAIDFVTAKKGWVQKHLARVKEYENQKQAFKDDFANLDRAAAKKQITGRLKELAEQHGFIYGRMSIRNQRARWGSCSGKGDISLNIKLVALPAELSDYVILHELVHTRIHNHSKKFWNELDKYVGNGKAKAKRLVEYGLKLL